MIYTFKSKKTLLKTNEGRSIKEFVVFIGRMKGGQLIAIPEINYSFLAPTDEHPICIRSRMERPLRSKGIEVTEVKEISRAIMKLLNKAG